MEKHAFKSQINIFEDYDEKEDGIGMEAVAYVGENLKANKKKFVPNKNLEAVVINHKV